MGESNPRAFAEDIERRTAKADLESRVRADEDRETELAALRAQLAAAEEDRDAAESRKSQAFQDLRARAESAETALAAARKAYEDEREGAHHMAGVVLEQKAALALDRKQREELVARLVALFDWQDDPSYLHASLHVENAVRNLRADLVVARMGEQQAKDAVHVILRQPVDHEFLDACGCEQCERVRASMVEAGYLKRIVPCAQDITMDCLDCGHRCTKYCRFLSEEAFDAAYAVAEKGWGQR